MGHPGLEPLRSGDFSGGDSDAAKHLRRLGFEVYSNRGPTWAKDELILACDLVYRNGWKGIDANDDRVRGLSHLLQQLPIHPIEMRGPEMSRVAASIRAGIKSGELLRIRIQIA
jgi:5-methylcytosine-specific restriction protein A